MGMHMQKAFFVALAVQCRSMYIAFPIYVYTCHLRLHVTHVNIIHCIIHEISMVCVLYVLTQQVFEAVQTPVHGVDEHVHDSEPN